jgi:hypothetical protein
MGAIKYFGSGMMIKKELDLSGFEPESVRTILMMDPLPNQKEADLYNSFIVEVKEGHGLSLGADVLDTIFDSLTIGCSHTRQAGLLNYVKNRHHKIAYNNPLFTKHRGLRVEPSNNAYVRSNFNPTISGVNFTDNSNVFGIFVINKRPFSQEGSYMGNGSSGGHSFYENASQNYRWFIGRNNSGVPQISGVSLFDSLQVQNFVIQGFRNGLTNGIKTAKGEISVSSAQVVQASGQFYEGCRRIESDGFGHHFFCTTSDNVFNGGSYYGSGTIDAAVMHVAYNNLFDALN